MKKFIICLLIFFSCQRILIANENVDSKLINLWMNGLNLCEKNNIENGILFFDQAILLLEENNDHFHPISTHQEEKP